MRIGELAHAADTTVRTVRHYHRLGLLPEPERTPGGYRVYGLTDLVRLLRIRWLARSGVPLGSVATVLAGPFRDPDGGDAAADLTADLESLLDATDTQIRTLQGKRDALGEMLRRQRGGEPLSPLPSPLVEAFDELIDGETDPRMQALFAQERDGLEMLAVTGHTSRAYFDALQTVLADPVHRRRLVTVYRRFGALSGRDPREAADEIAAVASALVAAIGESPGLIDTLEPWAVEAAAAAGPNPDVLAEILPDPAQHAAALGVIGRLAASASR
ncbi:MerR family DNA-binding transcriptional regulator [Rhodococcus hoagii]|nr:MerR family DNA-binding transcriptional regulator [Prescottella equi]